MIGFAAITLLVAARATPAFDREFTFALQSIASYPLDVLANVNTLAGQVTVNFALAGLTAIWLWRHERGLTWLAPGLIVLPIVVGVGMKFLLDHPGPPEEFHRAFWNPLGVAISTPSAYPSGHVSRVAFLAILAIGLVRAGWARALLVAFVLYTLWARVYIGDHWVSDAIGGLALGVTAGCAALAWLGWSRARVART